MSSSLLEIVELSDGVIELRRADDSEGEPIVRIQFSDEARGAIGDNSMTIAKAMIQAGMHSASVIGVEAEPEFFGDDERSLTEAIEAGMSVEPIVH